MVGAPSATLYGRPRRPRTPLGGARACAHTLSYTHTRVRVRLARRYAAVATSDDRRVVHRDVLLGRE